MNELIFPFFSFRFLFQCQLTGRIVILIAFLTKLIAGEEDGLFMLKFSGVASSCKWEECWLC